MRLGAKLLKNVNNVNSWVYTAQVFMQENQANSFYIQLVDLDQSISPGNEKSVAFVDFPIRYLTQATVFSTTVTFPHIDDVDEFTITGAQPFPDDKSIWKFNLSSSQIPSSGNIQVSVTEDGNIRSFWLKNAINVDSTNDIGSC